MGPGKARKQGRPGQQAPTAAEAGRWTWPSRSSWLGQQWTREWLWKPRSNSRQGERLSGSGQGHSSFRARCSGDKGQVGGATSQVWLLGVVGVIAYIFSGNCHNHIPVLQRRPSGSEIVSGLAPGLS